MFEDFIFTKEYVASIESIAFVKKTGYFYDISDMNSATKKYRENKLDEQLILEKEIEYFLKKYDIPLKKIVDIRKVNMCLDSLLNLVKRILKS